MLTILNSQASPNRVTGWPTLVSRNRATRWPLLGALLILAAASIPAVGLGAAPPRLLLAPGFARPTPPLLAPTSRDRVLVLAPHPDDESVPCGGLISEAVAAGAQVRVVYATYGDAFRTAAQKIFSESVVPSRDYLRLAEMRHREALAALAVLGLSHDQAVFLGYPDRGLDRLWLSHWELSSPYSSPYTKTDHGPYPNAYRPGRPYSGLALLEDLGAVIAEFRPTLILAPHPLDTHVDHWALYCFTLAALSQRGLLGSVPLWLYLVHPSSKWLSPARHLLDPTAPPAHADEVKTRWSSFALTEDAARRKREAIEKHATQLLLMHDFLLNFARKRELYGQIDPSRLPEIALNGPSPAQASWRGLPTAIVRFAEDAGSEPIPPAANLLALRAAASSGNLLLRLDLAAKPSPEVQYRVQLYPLAGGNTAPRTYTLQLGKPTPDVIFRAAGRSLDIEMRGISVPPDGVMLALDTRRGKTGLDHTAWVLLRPDPRTATQ